MSHIIYFLEDEHQILMTGKLSHDLIFSKNNKKNFLYYCFYFGINLFYTFINIIFYSGIYVTIVTIK